MHSNRDGGYSSVHSVNQIEWRLREECDLPPLCWEIDNVITLQTSAPLNGHKTWKVLLTCTFDIKKLITYRNRFARAWWWGTKWRSRAVIFFVGVCNTKRVRCLFCDNIWLQWSWTCLIILVQVAYFKTESDLLVCAFTEDKICNWDTTSSSLSQHKWQVYNVGGKIRCE